jgi:hypothetical protein
MRKTISRFNPCQRRGSALVLAIVMSVVVTGLVLTLSWAGGVQAEMTSNLKKIDQAFYEAESGVQLVAWYCKHNQMGSITSGWTPTKPFSGCTLTWTTSGSTVTVTSVSTYGTASYTCSEKITAPQAAAVIAGSGDFNNKNIQVIGNVSIGGNYTNGGSGSLTGNLVYAGSASNTGNVTGTVTQGTFAPLDMSSVETSLINAAGTTHNGSLANTVIDFTTVPATPGTSNKVVYVTGSMSNVTFVGSGTVYVAGAVSGGNFGTSIAPVNIVAGGSVSLTNNTMYGSLYVAGDLSTGHFDMTGLIYVAGTFTRSNSGQSSITMTSSPWFDPRGGSTGSGAPTAFANFTGPLP